MSDDEFKINVLHTEGEDLTAVLPAAAVAPGTLVRIYGRRQEFFVYKIQNSTPEPGSITWVDAEGLEEVVGGAERVGILEWPS